MAFFTIGGFYTLLNGNRGYVLHSLQMTYGNTIIPLILSSSHGTRLLENARVFVK